MKKTLLSAIAFTLITTGLFATNIKFDLTADYKNTKQLMNDMKKNAPIIYDVVTDYFQAKTCKEDITKNVSIKEIREFANTYQFGSLIELKYKAPESIIARTHYDILKNAYKTMNCGSEEAMGTYIGAVSAIAVEMNDKQAK